MPPGTRVEGKVTNIYHAPLTLTALPWDRAIEVQCFKELTDVTQLVKLVDSGIRTPAGLLPRACVKIWKFEQKNEQGR